MSLQAAEKFLEVTGMETGKLVCQRDKLGHGNEPHIVLRRAQGTGKFPISVSPPPTRSILPRAAFPGTGTGGSLSKFYSGEWT